MLKVHIPPNSTTCTCTCTCTYTCTCTCICTVRVVYCLKSFQSETSLVWNWIIKTDHWLHHILVIM